MKKDSQDSAVRCIQMRKLPSNVWLKQNQLPNTRQLPTMLMMMNGSRQQHVAPHLFLHLDDGFFCLSVDFVFFLDGLTLSSNFSLKLKSSSHLRNETSIAHTIIRTLYLVTLLAVILKNANVFGRKTFNKGRKRGTAEMKKDRAEDSCHVTSSTYFWLLSFNTQRIVRNQCSDLANRIKWFPNFIWLPLYDTRTHTQFSCSMEACTNPFLRHSFLNDTMNNHQRRFIIVHIVKI